MPLTKEQLATYQQLIDRNLKADPYTSRGVMPESYSVDPKQYAKWEGTFGEGKVPVWENPVALDDYVAHMQSGWDQAANGVVKGVGLAATTFIQGFTSIGGLLVGGVNAAFGGDFSLAYDNKINEAIDTFNKNMEEWFPNYYTNEQQAASAFSWSNLSSANFIFDKLVKNIGFTVGAIYGGGAVGSLSKSSLTALSKAMIFGKAAGRLGEGVAASEKVARLINIGKTMNRIDGASSMIAQLGAAAAESSIEAYGAKEEAMSALLAKYKEDYGPDATPSQEELAKMEDVAGSVGNGVFAFNMALLWGSNAVQFKKTMTGFTRQVQNNAKLIEEGVVMKEGKYMTKNAIAEAERAASKASRLRRVAEWSGKRITGVKGNLMEAAEEGAQTWATTTGTQYALAKYDNGGRDDLHALTESIAFGGKQLFNSKDGQESMLLGFITGGLSHMAIEGPKERKQRAREDKFLQSAVNTMNSYTAKDVVGASTRGMAISADQATAVEKNNKKTFEDTRAALFTNYIQTYVDLGAADIMYEQLEGLRNMPADELASFLDLDKNTATGTIHGKLDEKIRQAKAIQKTYEKYVNNVFTESIIENAKRSGNPFTEEDEMLVRKHWEAIRDGMFASEVLISDKQQRINSIVNEHSNILDRTMLTNAIEKGDMTAVNKSIDSLIASNVLIVTDAEKMRQAIKDAAELKKEIGDLNSDLAKLNTPEGALKFAEVASATKRDFEKDKPQPEPGAGVDNALDDFLKRKEAEIVQEENMNNPAPVQQPGQEEAQEPSPEMLDQQVPPEAQEPEIADNIDTGELGGANAILSEQGKAKLDKVKEDVEEIRNVKDAAVEGLNNSTDVNELNSHLAAVNTAITKAKTVGMPKEAIDALINLKDQLVSAIDDARRETEGQEMVKRDSALYNASFWVHAAARQSGQKDEDADRIVTKLLTTKTTTEIQDKIRFEVVPDTNYNTGNKVIGKDGKYSYNNKRQMAVQVVYVEGDERTVLGIFNKPDAFAFTDTGTPLTAEEMVNTLPADKAAQRTQALNNHGIAEDLYGLAESAWSENRTDITEEVFKYFKPVISQGQVATVKYDRKNQSSPYVLLSKLDSDQAPFMIHNGKPIIYEVRTVAGMLVDYPVYNQSGIQIPAGAVTALHSYASNGKLNNRFYAYGVDADGNYYWIPCELPDSITSMDKDGQLTVAKALADIVQLLDSTDAKDFDSPTFVTAFDKLKDNLYIAYEHKSGVFVDFVPTTKQGKKVIAAKVYTPDATLNAQLNETHKNRTFTTISVDELRKAVTESDLSEVGKIEAFVNLYNKGIEAGHPAVELGLVGALEENGTPKLSAVKAGIDVNNPDEVVANIRITTEPRGIKNKNIELRRREGVDRPILATPEVESQKAVIEQVQQEQKVEPATPVEQPIKEAQNVPNKIETSEFIKDKVVLTFTWGGYNSGFSKQFNTSINYDGNAKNIGGGTTADVRHNTDKVIALYGTTTKDQMGSDINFGSGTSYSYIAEEDGKKYLVVAISSRAGGVDAQRNGSIYASIELTDDLPTNIETLLQLELIKGFEVASNKAHNIFAKLPQAFINKVQADYAEQMRQKSTIAETVRPVEQSTGNADFDAILKQNGFTPNQTKHDDEINELNSTQVDEPLVDVIVNAERDNLQKMLPSWVSVEDIQKLGSLARQNGTTFGAFVDKVIYLASKAPKGTSYHEAFHTVFNLFLNNEQRSKLHEEQLKHRGGPITVAAIHKWLKDNPTQTGGNTGKELFNYARKRILEEEMAERFRHWKNSKGEIKQTGIAEWFRKLWDMIMSFFHNEGKLKRLFKDIEGGTFKNASLHKESNLGVMRLSMIPTGAKDGVNMYLAGNDSRRLINTIAAKYFDILATEGNGTKEKSEELLNKAVDEIAKVYDFNSVMKLNGGKLSPEKTKLLIQYGIALMPTNTVARELFRKEINNIDNILRVSESIADESAVDEVGAQSFDFRNEMNGGFAALSKEMRTFIAMTTVNRVNKFGVPVTETVDPHIVYNALGNLLINTPQELIMQKLELFKPIASEQVSAVIEKILNADITKQQKFKQAMDMLRVKYTSVLIKVDNKEAKEHTVINGNTKDYVEIQKENWQANYPTNTATKEAYIAGLTKLSDELFRDESTLSYDACVAKAQEIVKALNVEVTVNGNISTAGFPLSVGYIAFSLMKSRGDKTDSNVMSFLSMYPDVAAIQDCNPIATSKTCMATFIALASQTDANIMVPIRSKDTKKSDSFKKSNIWLSDIAENNVVFDENIGDDNFMNVEGERVWAKIKASFLMKQLSRIKRGMFAGLFSDKSFTDTGVLPDIKNEAIKAETIKYLRDNPLLKDALAGENNLGFANTMSKLAIGLTDGIREKDESATGKTWGSMTAGDQALFMMSCYASSAGGSKKEGAIKQPYKMYLRVLESSSTAYMIDAPLLNLVSNTDKAELNSDAINILSGFVEQEYNRINRVAKGEVSETIVGYNDKETGRGYKFFLASQLLIPELQVELEAAAKEGKPIDEFKDKIEASIRERMEAELDSYLRMMEEEGLTSGGNNKLLPAEFLHPNKTVDRTAVQRFLINDYVVRTTVNQMLDGDLSMTSKSLSDIIKRNKGAYAGTQTYIPGTINVISVEEYEEKDTKGNVINRDDGQGYDHMSWKIWKMMSLGLVSTASFDLYKRILMYNGDPRNAITSKKDLDLIRVLEEHGSALNPDKDVSFSTVEYDKKSGFTITRELCSTTDREGAEQIASHWRVFMQKWDGKAKLESIEEMKEFIKDLNTFERNTIGYWKPIKGRELMHQKLNLMITNNAQIINPASVSKRIKTNVAKYQRSETKDIAGLIDESTVKPNPIEASTYGKQQEVPSGHEHIIDGTQKLSLIWSEQPRDAETQKLVNSFFESMGKRIEAQAALAINILKERDANGNVTYTQKRVMDGIRRSLEDTGASQQLIDMFSLREDGTSVYDFNNTPNSKEIAIREFLTHFRMVFKQKVHGDANVLASDVGLKILRNSEGQVVSPYEYSKMMFEKGEEYVNNLGLKEQELRYDVAETINGVTTHYAEILIPARTAEMYRLKPGDSIPEELARSFGVRIPTQDKQSMMAYKVVGFLPAYYGSTVVFPKEIILYKGTDFDIDKEFMQFYETYKKMVKKNGKTTVTTHKFGDSSSIQDPTQRTQAEFDELQYYYSKQPIVKNAVREVLADSEPYRETKAKIDTLYKELNEEPEEYDFDDVETEVLEQAAELEKAVTKEQIAALKLDLFEMKKEATKEVFKDLGIPTTVEEFKSMRTARNAITFNVAALNNEMMKLETILLTGNEQAWNATQTAMDDSNAKGILDKINDAKRGGDASGALYDEGELRGVHHPNDIIKACKKVKVGGDNIGIAARSNVTMNLLAHFNTTLNKDYIVTVVTPDGKTMSLDQFVYRSKLTGRRVNEDMAENITLQVDAVKGDMPYKLNLTTDVLPAVVTAIGLGAGSEFAYMMAKSKAVVDLAKNLSKYKSAINVDEEYEPTDNRIRQFYAKYLDKYGLKAEDVENKPINAADMVKACVTVSKSGLTDTEYGILQCQILNAFIKFSDISKHVKLVGDVQALHKGDMSSFSDTDVKKNAYETLTTAKDQPFSATEPISNPYINALMSAFNQQNKIAESFFIQRNPEVVKAVELAANLLSPGTRNNTTKRSELEEEFYRYMISVIFRQNASDKWKAIISSMIADNQGTITGTDKAYMELLKALPTNAFLRTLSKEQIGEGDKSFVDIITDTRTKLHPDLQDAINAAAEGLYFSNSEEVASNTRKLIVHAFLKSNLRFTNKTFVKHMSASMFKPLSGRIRRAKQQMADTGKVPSFFEGEGSPVYEFLYGLCTNVDYKVSKHTYNIKELKSHKGVITENKADTKPGVTVKVTNADGTIIDTLVPKSNATLILDTRIENVNYGMPRGEEGKGNLILPLYVTSGKEVYVLRATVSAPTKEGTVTIHRPNASNINTEGRVGIYRLIPKRGYNNVSPYPSIPEAFEGKSGSSKLEIIDNPKPIEPKSPVIFPGTENVADDIDYSSLDISTAVPYTDGGWGTTGSPKVEVKEGVQELFESNPELANAVYEVAGFSNLLSLEAILKEYTIEELKQGVTLRSLQNKIEEKDFETIKLAYNYLKSEEKYRHIKNSNEQIESKLEELREELRHAKETKVGSVLTIINDDNNSEYKVRVIEINKYSDYAILKVKTAKNKEYTIRVESDGSTKTGFIEDFVFKATDTIDTEAIKSEINNLKSQLQELKSDYSDYYIDYFENHNQISPQQKQQAQQLYSQYIDTIFPDSKVKDIVYHGSPKTKLEKIEGISFWTNEIGNAYAYNIERNEDNSEGFVTSAITNIKNPHIHQEDRNSRFATTTPKDLIDTAKSKNADGAIWKDVEDIGGRETQIVVFEPEQIHILGSKQDIEGFKKYIDDTSAVTETPTNKSSEVYTRLGDKTVSENVVIVPWNELKNAQDPISDVIVATRIHSNWAHFGNPFSHDPAGKAAGLIKTETVKEAVEKYIDWVINSDDKRAEWIREQLKSGKLKNKTILYYKELGEPSHATALDYLINKYDWGTNTITETPTTLPDDVAAAILQSIDDARAQGFEEIINNVSPDDTNSCTFGLQK